MYERAKELYNDIKDCIAGGLLMMIDNLAILLYNRINMEKDMLMDRRFIFTFNLL
jgi:hypothetical protein